MIAMCSIMLWFKPKKDLTEEDLETRINNLLLLKKILYSLITVVLAVLLLVQVAQCILKYLDEPTYMSNKIVKQYDAEFPSITVCPWNPYYKSKILREKYNLSDATSYYKLKDLEDDLMWHDGQGEDIFEDITYDLEDLISDFRIRYLKTNNDSLSMMLRPKISELKYRQKLHRKFGKCFSLSLADMTDGRGIYYAKMKLKKNVKIYAHAKDQFLDLSGRMGYELNLGETTKFQVNYQIFNALSDVKDRPNCSFSSYDDCMYDSMKNKMLSKYGCIAPWIPHDLGSDLICTNSSDKRGVYQIIYNRQNDCLDPCNYMIVNVGGKTVIPADASSTYLFLYFAHRIPKTEEYYLYDFLSLLAEIGGYCGLFLGYSAFHIAVLIGEMFNTAIREYEKRFKKKQTIPM